jgi:hypothetical protein
VGFQTGYKVGVNPQIARKIIFSLTEIIQISRFVCELNKGMENGLFG